MRLLLPLILLLSASAWAEEDTRMEEAKKKWEARLNSPDELSRDICQRFQINKRLARYLPGERKEVASGKASEEMKRNLKHTETSIADNKKFMDEKKAKYKEAAGKEWSPSICKD